MTLGQKLRQMRLERGLTQKQLAGDRVTRNMLSQIENDQAVPSVRTLEYLASVLEVDAGWLMSRADESGEQVLAQARALLREKSYEACLSRLEQLEPADETLLMQSVCACRLARQALEDEQFARAEQLAADALRCSENCLYADATLQVEAAAVLARCKGTQEAMEQYRTMYLSRQGGVQYHLTMARCHLEQEHVQAAEREIWLIAELPEAHRAEYLILRGRIAARKEQFENALLYLQQAKELAPLPKLLERELLQALELCYRETGQYQQAYECAAAQREL